MHLISIGIYVILFYGKTVEMILFKDHFRLFVQSVATIFHSDWRKDYLRQHPHTKHRFKLTHDYQYFNQTDFIYPMIIPINKQFISCLVHRNLKIAQNRFNASLIYVDILNMDYRELPKDRAEDNRITARIACKHVWKNHRQKHSFNQYLIEQISDRIHVQWMRRNRHTDEKHLLVPYQFLSEIEKNKDRKAIFIACRVFNEQFFFKRFNTTPIHFIQPIN